jgi:diguanylate cyclase (GGDEF)-like protein/hemerythrin-like metal-binding protein
LVRAVGTIIDRDGRRMRPDANAVLVPALAEEGVFARIFGKEFPIVYKDEGGRQRSIGTWTVYSDRKVIIQRIEYGFTLILISAIVKATALWFIFLFVVQRWLGRPLNQLGDFVRQLNIDNLGDQAFVLRDRARHELHFLADALNDMVRKLRRSIEQNSVLYRQLEGEQGALRELNENLEQRVAERTSDLMAANQKLGELSATDGLTGLANRRRLDEVLADECARAQRASQMLALIMLDVDHFKMYNDHYGHQAGDECLRMVANAMRTSARRPSDLAARYGGEEFVVIAPDNDGDSAFKLAEGIRRSVEALAIPHAQSPMGLVTVSLGVAVLMPDAGWKPEDLLRLADDALYRAKNDGRNRVELLLPPNMAGGSTSPDESIIRLNWKAGYVCGEPTIDREHIELFRLANRLLDLAVNSSVQTEEFHASFDGLLSHLREHFANEEALLRQHGYEDVDEHTKQHQRLLERALSLRRQAEASGTSVGELVNFLAMEVVARHMLREDRAFYGIFAGTMAVPDWSDQ